MKTQRLAGVVLSALALSACAAAGGSSTASRTTFESYDDCFFARTLSDWRPLDPRNLLVFAAGRQPYHVQLATPSRSLNFEDAIGFYDRDGRICPYGGDAVVVNGLIPDRIPIASIRRLSEGELEALYAEFGIRRPAVIDAADAGTDAAAPESSN
jgi:hypothetical protein